MRRDNDRRSDSGIGKVRLPTMRANDIGRALSVPCSANPKLKILRSVVVSNPVAVMHGLTLAQRTAKNLLHNVAMLGNGTVLRSHMGIARGRDISLPWSAATLSERLGTMLVAPLPLIARILLPVLSDDKAAERKEHVTPLITTRSTLHTVKNHSGSILQSQNLLDVPPTPDIASLEAAANALVRHDEIRHAIALWAIALRLREEANRAP